MEIPLHDDEVLAPFSIIGRVPKSAVENPVVINQPGENIGVQELTEIIEWMFTEQRRRPGKDALGESRGPLARAKFTTGDLLPVKFFSDQKKKDDGEGEGGEESKDHEANMEQRYFYFYFLKMYVKLT